MSIEIGISSMKLDVRLFARARDLAGSESISVELGDSATVGDLKVAIEEQHPSLKLIVGHLHVALGTDYANDSTVLQPDSDVSCFPPVSGG